MPPWKYQHSTCSRMQHKLTVMSDIRKRLALIRVKFENLLGNTVKNGCLCTLTFAPGLDWQVLGHSFPTETEKQPISMKLEDREKIPTGSTARESVKNRKTPAKISRDGTYDSCWDIWVRTTLLDRLTPPLHGLKSDDIYDSDGILDSLTEGVFKGEGVFGKS